MTNEEEITPRTMTRNKSIILGLAVFVVLVGVVALVWMQRSTAKARAAVAEYEKYLDSSDPDTRLGAASAILEINPYMLPARLAKAQALIELERPARARESLFGMANNKQSPFRLRALTLLAESYLIEAEGIATNAQPINTDLVSDQLDPLLNEASSIGTALASDALTSELAPIIQARVYDCRVTLLRTKQKAYSVDLTKARAVGSDEHVEIIGVEADKLLSEIKELDGRILSISNQILQANPLSEPPRSLLFRFWLRAGDIAKARQVALDAAAQNSLGYAVAGDIAGKLTTLENRYGLPVTRTDAQIAEKLLKHPKLTGSETLDYRLAWTDLHLYQGRYTQAEQNARKILSDYDGHPRATSQLAFALMGQGKAEQAIKFLLPAVERLQTPFIRYVLGAAYLRAGQLKQSHEMLRQSLDAQPDLLPPRLLLAESLVSGGFTVEAETDILTATALSPDHPRAIALQARLMLARADVAGLIILLKKGRDPSSCGPQAQDSLLAARMVMDDTASVSQLTGRILANDPTNTLAVLANGWTYATPKRRCQIAGAVCQFIYESLDTDPLFRAAPAAPLARPSLIEIDYNQQAINNANESKKTDRVRRVVNPDLLLVSHYIPRPERQALELIELSLDRWPGNEELLLTALTLNLFLGDEPAARQRLEQIGAAKKSPLLQAVSAYLDRDFKEAQSRLDSLGSSPEAFSPLHDWLVLACTLGQQDFVGATEQIEAYFKDHAWSEHVLLMAVRWAVGAGDVDQAFAFVDAVKKTNNQVGLLTSARLHLALNEVSNALHNAEMLLSEESGGSEIRRFAAEIRAMTNMAEGRVELATAIFENMALSMPYRRVESQTAAIDVLLEAGRIPQATAGITTLLADPRTSLFWTDRLLARARHVVPAERISKLLDGLLKYKPNEPILLVYKAQSLIDMDNLASAVSLVNQLGKQHPESPRVLMLTARLAGRLQHAEEAMQIYQRLLELGGSTAVAAGRDLENLLLNSATGDAAATTQPSLQDAANAQQ